MKLLAVALLCVIATIPVGLLSLGLVRMWRRDPADPVFGEGRDDE